MWRLESRGEPVLVTLASNSHVVSTRSASRGSWTGSNRSAGEALLVGPNGGEPSIRPVFIGIGAQRAHGLRMGEEV